MFKIAHSRSATCEANLLVFEWIIYFLYRHLLYHLIFFQLVRYVLHNFYIVLSWCIYIIPSTPELSISVFKFHIRILLNPRLSGGFLAQKGVLQFCNTPFAFFVLLFPISLFYLIISSVCSSLAELLYKYSDFFFSFSFNTSMTSSICFFVGRLFFLFQ